MVIEGGWVANRQDERYQDRYDSVTIGDESQQVGR